MSKNSLPSELNKKQWESNLARSEKAKNARKYTKVVDSLSQMNNMPTEQLILDRIKCLTANLKSRQERVVIVVKEVKIWEKLNFPIQQDKSTVERKILNVLKRYEKGSRKPGTQDFTNLFNITDEKGEWLCQEDRDFCNNLRCQQIVELATAPPLKIHKEFILEN